MEGSPNTFWNHKAEEMITSYKVRPILISDEEVIRLLLEHFKDLTYNDVDLSVDHVREIMAKRIFALHLKFDIICLQEADYLDESMFPEEYDVIIKDSAHLKNGIAWNHNRFEFVKILDNETVSDKAFAIELRDRNNDKTILVATGHLTGCNPYYVEKSKVTGIADSEKEDTELQDIIKLLEDHEADLKIIGMDSNVTSLHPRLKLIKDADYRIDYENFIEMTCTNPYQLMNTRIDWIALKTEENVAASITNIPVLSVGLNNIQTNISDHKPIAAKIVY